MTTLDYTALYNLTTELLLGFKMDNTLFGQLLGQEKGNIEQSRPWVILRNEDQSNIVNPQSNNISNSSYLIPVPLPADFLNMYSPTRSLCLVGNDGITFRWYKQIPLEYKQQYKDATNRFYIKGSNFYLCGTLDQQYTAHIFYIQSSPDININVPWVFPVQFQPILAYYIAQRYRTAFDYDVVNVQQGTMIEKMADIIFKNMEAWDAALQEQALSGVDYRDEDDRGGFNSKTVPDNNT